MQGQQNTQLSLLKHIIYICEVLFISLLCVIPAAYGIGGIYGSILPVVLALIYGYTLCARKQYIVALILSICIGLFISLVILAFTSLTVIYSLSYFHIFFIAFTIVSIIGVIIASGTLNFTLFRKIRKEHRLLLFKYFGILSLIALIIYIIASFTHIDDGYYVRAISLAIIFGLLFGFVLYNVVNLVLLPEIEVYKVMIKYLQAMLLPVGAFIVGYLVLILLFAGFFTLCYRANISSFVGSSHYTFLHFVYYSINIITTLGATQIEASSSTAKILAGTEVVLGMMWVTVILAAAISHFQTQFNKINIDVQKATID